jgi:RimJ/RimL family protein N-acetyltransferase
MDGAGEQALTIVRWFKDGPPGAIPIVQHGQALGALEAITWRDAHSSAALERLLRWQESAASTLPTRFPATVAGARAWLIEQVLEVPTRLLFWVKALDGLVLGQVGLVRLDGARGTAEIGHLVRGEAGALSGALSASVATLCDWAFEALRLRSLELRVALDNEPALRLARHCGFQETRRAGEMVTLCLVASARSVAA